MNTCFDGPHLKPFIWPGHARALGAVDTIIKKISDAVAGISPLSPELSVYLRAAFGSQSTLPVNLSAILVNFKIIQAALNDNYLYKCADPCQKPNAGSRAWTERSGNRDITLCFDQVAGYDSNAAAWLIIHENVHRGLNAWSHEWELKNFAQCISPKLGDRAFVPNNPDSFACTATLY